MLFPKYFTDRNEPAQLGWVLMALSVGGLVGALGYAVLSKYSSKRAVMLTAVLTLGVAMTIIAFLPPLPVILVLCAVVGFVYGPIAPIYNYVMQTRAPAASARPGGRRDGLAGLRGGTARPDRWPAHSPTRPDCTRRSWRLSLPMLRARPGRHLPAVAAGPRPTGRSTRRSSWAVTGRRAISRVWPAGVSAIQASDVLLTWPLIGRSEEMQTIVAAVSAPGLAGILVSGPAGVGKSRIVREAMSSVAPKGFEPRWVVGTTSARNLPLGAFAPWAGIRRTDRLQLVRGVIESVTSSPPGTTVVLGVDDVHLLDELSTFVLHQIVQREAAKVVLTVREGERVPTEMYEIWRGGQFDRLDLQPLSADETAELLAATLGGPVDPDAAPGSGS